MVRGATTTPSIMSSSVPVPQVASWLGGLSRPDSTSHSSRRVAPIVPCGCGCPLGITARCTTLGTRGGETEPEPFAGGRRIVWPRGRVLGGCSTINGLVYIRGQPEDYDDWAALGNAGWGWDDVLPLFRRSEDQCRGADAYHGIGGPMGVSDITPPDPLCDDFINAAERLGIPRNADFNGPSQEGVGYFQLCLRRGLRCGAARFLDGASPQAGSGSSRARSSIGSLSRRGERSRSWSSRGSIARNIRPRELILSAGGIGSPCILQRSGVGDPQRLRTLGIEVRVESPGVGENLQDHYQARAIFRCNKPWTRNAVHRRWGWRTSSGAPLAPIPRRPAHDRCGLCRPLHEKQSERGSARHSIPSDSVQRRASGRVLAPVFGVHGLGLPASPRESGPRANPVREPEQ